jgi:hypothetical protein
VMMNGGSGSKRQKDGSQVGGKRKEPKRNAAQPGFPVSLSFFRCPTVDVTSTDEPLGPVQYPGSMYSS